MTTASWQVGALASTLGIATFAWGLARGGGDETVTTRVFTWPRSRIDSPATYAVQVLVVGNGEAEVQARVPVECAAADERGHTESLHTDESGFLTFSAPGALSPRTCRIDQGTFAVEGPPPAVGEPSFVAPFRAPYTGTPIAVYLEAPELTIGADMLAWVAQEPEHVQNLVLAPEPGLEAHVLARCLDGFALSLRASYHVIALALEWGPESARQRASVATPVSRGGPAVTLARDESGRQLASLSDANAHAGWLALFDARGLVAMGPDSERPWPLPALAENAVLVGSRGSFFDSARTVRRVPARAASTCERARSLAEPWPAAKDRIEVSDGRENAYAARARRIARGRRTASFGLAGGLLGVGAALMGVRNARVTARALGALAIAVTLFGVLALLLYT